MLNFIILFSVAFSANADEAMMSMPKIQPKRVFTVPSVAAGEELRENRGFGEKESEIRMMNLMMVGGSGYEGMDMAEAKAGGDKSPHTGHSGHAAAAGPRIEITTGPSSAKVGANLYEFTVKDLKSGKMLSGLKPVVQVYMTNMDMGVDTPKVKETKPGQYEVKAIFSMAGPWALKIVTHGGESVINIPVSR